MKVQKIKCSNILRWSIKYVIAITNTTGLAEIGSVTVICSDFGSEPVDENIFSLSVAFSFEFLKYLTRNLLP